MTYILTAILALSAGWSWGHRTARIVRIPIGALHEQDEAALDTADEQLLAEWRARLDQLTAPFDIPDDPRSSAA